MTILAMDSAREKLVAIRATDSAEVHVANLAMGSPQA